MFLCVRVIIWSCSNMLVCLADKSSLVWLCSWASSVSMIVLCCWVIVSCSSSSFSLRADNLLITSCVFGSSWVYIKVLSSGLVDLVS